MTTHARSVSADDVRAARPAVDAIAKRTPMLSTRTLSERVGGTVALKAENLQRTGSFKVRGATAKLAALGDAGCRGGVVCASAGNPPPAGAPPPPAPGGAGGGFRPHPGPLPQGEG